MSRTRRRPGPTAFRAAPAAVPAARPSRRQAVALLAVLAVVVGTAVAVSYLVRPDRARSFDLFHGSVFLADSVAPVAVDLASGRPTVRLIDAEAQVGARTSSDLTVTPLSQGTLLLNRASGEFNLVAATGFVVKTSGGVPIAARSGSTGVTAISSGELAYLEQTGPTGTSVYLVGQSTVETASNVAARVRPRAFRSMPEAGSTDPGAAASANGSLWLLLGDGDRRVVRQLDLPPNSSTGATLRSVDHGRVSGPAALASASTSGTFTPTTSSDAGGAPADVVALASSDHITVYRGSSTVGTARFPAVAGLDRVLPASGGQGRLSFLFHGSAGWSVASLGADGRDLRGPTRLTGLSADAALAAPAVSRDALYTMDTTSGALVRIGADDRTGAIAGAADYPLAEQGGRVVEPGGFGDGTVIARGSRVIYNSPTHLNAIVVFTDGSHRPLTIEKSSAVAVSAAGGAESLTRSRVDAAAPRSTPSPATQPKAENPVNNKIDCRTVRQKPHIPTIVNATPGSRSVALAWTYPLLSPQDCVPSTYQVNVTALSAGAPSPPAHVTVQGQQSVNLAGLFPSTQYEVSVGAYINGQGTVSAARRITTGPEGPAAPGDVSASTDAAGNWNVTWSSCGSTAKGCVAAASWQVVPEFCDGRGLSGAPSSISVTADPTSVTQPPAQLQGGDALLGRGLRFQVEGTGTQGTVGRPSAYSACTYSWSPPVAGALTLRASTAPLEQLGSTTSATVTLSGATSVHATGGVGAMFTYRLLSGGNTVKTIGPTTQTSVSFDGISAGRQYQAAASVAPPRHPEAAVAVGPVTVNAATAPWPTISAQVGSPSNNGAAQATVTVNIGGLTSAAADGERFALINSSFQCGGSAGFELDRTDLDPADPISFTVDRTRYYGSCTVTVQLQQYSHLTTPSLFGDGTSSNADTSNSFTVDPPTLTGVGGGDFNASWGGSAGGQSRVKIVYTGGNPLIGLASGWSASVIDPDGASCGGYSGAGELSDVAVTQSCVDNNGASGTNWKVVVSFGFLLQARQSYTITGIDGGGAPTYSPPACDVGSAGLTAQWSGTKTAPSVTIGAGNAAQVKDCANWSYTVSSPATPDACGTGSGAPGDNPSVAVTCTDTPAASGWSVTATYQDTDGSTKTAPAVPVTGTPPD